MRHVQALLNWILLSTGRTDLKRLVVVVVVAAIYFYAIHLYNLCVLIRC